MCMYTCIRDAAPQVSRFVLVSFNFFFLLYFIIIVSMIFILIFFSL